jgi:lipopolysaccharide export system permease protein
LWKFVRYYSTIPVLDYGSLFVMIKKLDKLVFTSIMPPFVASFFIALFVLMMQFLWLWIDDIIGKGIDIFVIIELLGYLIVHLIPLSIPIAVLISSVMVFGNLAESHELSSFKSAGVSLLRIKRSALVFGLFCSVFAFISADYFVPVATLKYRTRLFDIKKQKPALNIAPGIFNYDFQGYTIYVKDKGKNNRDLSGVIIYDYSSSSPFMVNMIAAKSGEMYPAVNNRYLEMKLYDGFQMQEMSSPGNEPGQENVSFIRSSFEVYTKRFDLSEFEISRSEEGLFESHQDMMNAGTLLLMEDSIRQERQLYQQNVLKEYKREFRYTLDTITKKDSAPVKNGPNLASSQELIDLLYIVPLSQTSGIDFLDRFKSTDRRKLLNFTNVKILDARTRCQIAAGSDKVSMESIARNQYSRHTKYSNAIICLVFMIIGASLGAIVRKGGYGYPLLISIIFFMIFISLNTAYKKLAETLHTDAVIAAWAPVFWLSPIAVLVLYMAQFDIRFSLFSAIKSLSGGLKRNKTIA